MRIYKCDRCNKEIKEGQQGITEAGIGYKAHQLCKKCGEPIARILKRYKLAK